MKSLLRNYEDARDFQFSYLHAPLSRLFAGEGPKNFRGTCLHMASGTDNPFEPQCCYIIPKNVPVVRLGVRYMRNIFSCNPSAATKELLVVFGDYTTQDCAEARLEPQAIFA